MAQFLLGTTDLSEAAVSKLGEQDAFASYPELVEFVQSQCGPAVASLFAEPVRGYDRARQVQNVAWFSAYEGTPYSLAQMPSAAARSVTDLLKARLKAFSGLLSDPKHGPALASWLNILSASDILSVAGQPVVKNWGMVPASIASSEQAREANYRRTIENYLPPNTPLPPFNVEEAQSFPERLTQATMRNQSISARASQMRSLSEVNSAVPPPASQPSDTGPTRWPWLSPIIAIVIALALIGIFSFFQLLEYPPPPYGPTAEQIREQQLANQKLRDRLSVLNEADSTKTCQIVPGVKPLPSGEDMRKLLSIQPEKLSTPPPPPTPLPGKK
jgi:hypothetical protein